MKQIKSGFLTSLIVMLVAGCSLAPSYHRPETVAPKQWKNDTAMPAAASVKIASDWWKQFGSSELDRLDGRSVEQ